MLLDAVTRLSAVDPGRRQCHRPPGPDPALRRRTGRGDSRRHVARARGSGRSQSRRRQRPRRDRSLTSQPASAASDVSAGRRSTRRCSRSVLTRIATRWALPTTCSRNELGLRHLRRRRCAAAIPSRPRGRTRPARPASRHRQLRVVHEIPRAGLAPRFAATTSRTASGCSRPSAVRAATSPCSRPAPAPTHCSIASRFRSSRTCCCTTSGPVTVSAQGAAEASEIRTPALWGLRLRRPLLHDGSASTIEDAILRHAGEAEPARTGYEQLSSEERQQLLTFLRSL